MTESVRPELDVHLVGKNDTASSLYGCKPSWLHSSKQEQNTSQYKHTRTIYLLTYSHEHTQEIQLTERRKTSV